MFGSVPAASVRRLAKWVRSGPARPPASVPRIVWQSAQPRVMKTCSPAKAPASAASRADAEFADLSLPGPPSFEIGFTLGDHQEGHMCVLPAAELRALPTVPTRASGGERQHIVLARDQILLAGQVGSPEAMDDIRRLRSILTGRPTGT